MSKCAVFSTSNLNFLYWTLLRPKYCAWTGGATVTAAADTARAAAIRRTPFRNFKGSPPSFGERSTNCTPLQSRREIAGQGSEERSVHFASLSAAFLVLWSRLAGGRIRPIRRVDAAGPGGMLPLTSWNARPCPTPRGEEILRVECPVRSLRSTPAPGN